jgi:hypothetical protein
VDGGGRANRRRAIGHCDWIRRAQRQLVASRCPCPAACSDAASGGRCDRRAQSGLSRAPPFQTSIGSLSLTGSPSSSTDGTESAVSDCGPCTGERNAQPPVVRARSPWVNHHPAGSRCSTIHIAAALLARRRWSLHAGSSRSRMVTQSSRFDFDLAGGDTNDTNSTLSDIGPIRRACIVVALEERGIVSCFSSN